MIIKSEYNKIKKSLSTHHAYFDPDFNANLEESIRILPLLIDQTLIYLNKNNPLHSSLIKSCNDLINENIFTPVSICENNLPDSLISPNCIFRDRFLDEALFTIEYEELIQKDYEDEKLKLLFETSKLNKEPHPSFNKTVFSLNWDIIFSQIIGTPLILDSKLHQIFSYKCSELMGACYPQSLNYLLKIKNFIGKINPVFPAGLDIDKIRQFRKERVAITFRNWLEENIANVYLNQEYGEILVDDYLVKEFNKMSASYADKANLISYSISGALASVIGGLTTKSVIGTAVIGTLGTTVGYPFSKLLKKFWERNGPNPWVFLLNTA